MADKDLVSLGLQFLEDKGWSDLIDSRWEEEVKNDLLTEFPNIDKQSLDEIIDIVIW